MNTSSRSTDRVVWQTAGGGAHRQGFFPQSLSLNFRSVCRLTTQGIVRASVVFDRVGWAFVADMAGYVQAFSSAGQRQWQTKIAGGLSASPALHEHEPMIFAGSHTGRIVALDTKTGATCWQTEIPSASDPRILSDLLFWPGQNLIVFSSWGGQYHALEADTGAAQFAWNAGLSPAASPAAGPSPSLYFIRVIAKQGLEYCRISPNGQETVLHAEPENGRGANRTLASAGPIIDDTLKRAYFLANRDEDCLLRAWSLEEDKLVWTHLLPHPVQATPTLKADGTIVIADLAGQVLAIDVQGHRLWQYASGAEYLLAGGVNEAGGRCFVGDPLGRLHRIDDHGHGRPVFTAPRSIESRPSFSPAGDLYLPAGDRTIYVFQPQS